MNIGDIVVYKNLLKNKHYLPAYYTHPLKINQFYKIVEVVSYIKTIAIVTSEANSPSSKHYYLIDDFITLSEYRKNKLQKLL